MTTRPSGGVSAAIAGGKIGSGMVRGATYGALSGSITSSLQVGLFGPAFSPSEDFQGRVGAMQARNPDKNFNFGKYGPVYRTGGLMGKITPGITLGRNLYVRLPDGVRRGRVRNGLKTMPRKKRQRSSTGIYHWIVRGINKKKLFHDSQDFFNFKNLLIEYKSKDSISIYHYCVMTNHVHLLMRADDLNDLSQFSHFIQRRYAYYYCSRYHWTGGIFQRGFRSFAIDREEYLLECGRYIERNPLKAGIVDKPEDYEYSSYRFYANKEPDSLLIQSPAFMGLSELAPERSRLYQKYVLENRIQEEMIDKGLLLT